jgi:hypothetical protein
MTPPMGELAALRRDDTRFFDGGDDSHPPDPSKPPAFEFRRVMAEGRERFQVLRRIGYRTRAVNGQPSRTFVVPRDLRVWTTDFASVPWFFVWLVPKSGTHLPAALVHDGLVDEPPNYIGPAITRDDADLVFKEAMADLGTGVVRRWLIWTAVTLATIFLRQVGPAGSRARWYYVAVAGITLAIVVWLGVLATLDVLDVALNVPGLFELPWMRSETFWIDVIGGAAGAVVIPALLGLLWGRFWPAGVIAGIALAFLLHVSVIILALTGVYVGLEKLGTVARGRVLLSLLVAVGLFAAVVFGRALG